MIKGDIEWESDNFGKIPAKLMAVTKRVFSRVGMLTASYLRQEKFTGGTTTTKLAVRTGRLRASVQTIPPKEVTGGIEGGVRFGTVYARVHVGRKGQVTTIKPKKGKFLAIPLPAAMTRGGVARGAPRTGPWGETFVRRVGEAREEKLIIFGKKQVTEGARAGQARGQVVPLFLLMRSVKVKARIHPEEILRFMEPKIIEGFKAEKIIVGG